jgi:hypothetical protein
MADTDELAQLEAEIARAINEGDIIRADELREEWRRLWLLERVTPRA